jgi:hypothetical protein
VVSHSRAVTVLRDVSTGTSRPLADDERGRAVALMSST